uniref:T-cell surface glycoprotein CD3 zeta chain n=1 Tax=Cynoglossus semilaevis TaxID=244447 RepID=A0A3P8VLK8_CYNSE
MVAVSQTFGVLLLLTSVFAQADAMKMYEPGLCFILDGFLGLYGLFITGLLIKEKFFKSKTMSVEEGLYHDPRGQSDGGYDQLRQQERGRNRLANNDETYTGLTRRTEGEYKELPIKREVRFTLVFTLSYIATNEFNFRKTFK